MLGEGVEVEVDGRTCGRVDWVSGWVVGLGSAGALLLLVEAKSADPGLIDPGLELVGEEAPGLELAAAGRTTDGWVSDWVGWEVASALLAGTRDEDPGWTVDWVSDWIEEEAPVLEPGIGGRRTGGWVSDWAESKWPACSGEAAPATDWLDWGPVDSGSD